MTFSCILDQPTAVRTLQSALRKERVPHALLFVGPTGVGRKATARIFAAALNCERSKVEPCGACSSCRLIAEGRHPDVHLILPTKRSATITVEQVEDLLPFVYMRPIKGRTKVFILSEADRLGISSANKMLKILEEPPGSTVFILVTERPESMLATVVSRCQGVKFGRLRAESVRRILAHDFHVDPERAGMAAELADGQITRGLQFSDPERFEAVMNVFDSLEGCTNRLRAYDRLLALFTNERLKLEDQAQKEIAAGPEELTSAVKASLADMRKAFVDRHYRGFLNDCFGLLLTFYRDILVMRETGADTFIFNRDKGNLLRRLAEQTNVSALLANVKTIEEAAEYSSHYVPEDRVFLDLLLRLRLA